MDDNDFIDPKLLKRIIMGEFSADISHKSSKKKSNSAKRNVELDLHFEKLYPGNSHFSSSEKLTMQLDGLIDFINECQRKSVRNAIVVVGKGEGILKKEVCRRLESLNLKNSEVLNAPYFGNAIKIYF
ncbi:MAG: Smr/MutS family protein [Bacteroidia bacterium]